MKGVQGEVAKQFGPVGTEADKAGKKAGGRFKSSFGKIAAAAGGLFAVSKGLDFMKTGVTDARAFTKSMDGVAAVIASTGGVANVSVKDIEKMSGALEAKTAVDDEVIASSARLLLTFKNVQNEVGEGANVFDRAMASAIDLSAAGFGSVDSTAKQLGKALNDPLKGISALGRAGVTFTAQQQDQIKALVKTGDTLEAQKIIMAEVESQVGGVAESQLTAADKAAVGWDNLRQQIGDAMVPVIDKVSKQLSSKVIPAISTFVTQMQTGTGAGGRFVDSLRSMGNRLAAVAKFLNDHRSVVLALIGAYVAYRVGVLAVAAAQTVSTAATKAASAATAAYNGVKALSNSYLAVFVGVKALELAAWTRTTAATVASTTATIAQTVASKAAAAAAKAWAAVQWLLNAAMSANPLGLVVVAVAALVAAIVIAWKNSETFRNIVIGAWNAIKAATSAVFGWIKSFINLIWKGIKLYVTTYVKVVKAVVTGAWNAIKATTSAIWNGIKATIIGAWNAIKAVVTTYVKIVRTVITAAWNGVKAVTSGVWNFVRTAITGAIDKIITKVTGIKGKVVGALKGAGTWLFDAGKNIVEGLIGGAGSLLKDLGSMFLDQIPGWIKGPFKKALGIESPSKVFAEFGRFIVLGLAQGINKNAKRVTYGLDSLMKAIDKALKKKDIGKAAAKRMKSALRAIERGTAKMASLISARNAMASEIASGFRDEFDLSAITAPNEYGFSPGAGSAVAAAQGIVARMKAFAQQLAGLVKQGMPPALVQEIAGMGSLEGGRVASTFLSATSAQAGQLRTAYSDFNRYANQAGNVVAGQQYGKQIDRQQAINESIERGLERGLGKARFDVRLDVDRGSAVRIYKLGQREAAKRR